MVFFFINSDLLTFMFSYKQRTEKESSWQLLEAGQKHLIFTTHPSSLILQWIHNKLSNYFGLQYITSC